MTALKKLVPFEDLTIEYHVLGALDGTTLAPDIDLDPASPGYNEPDERGIHIVEVPGNTTAAALSMAIGSSGSVHGFRTTALMTMAEATEAMKKAGDAGYQAPR